MLNFGSPIYVYAFMAAGLAGLLMLHLSLLKQLEMLRQQVSEEQGSSRLALARFREEIADTFTVKAKEEPPADPPGLTGWHPPASALNVNKRVQAMRMARRGDPPERVAALLGVSRREVELLLKVQSVVTAGPEAARGQGA